MMTKPAFLGKDFIPERIKLNGNVTTVFRPKQTISLEEFVKEIEPIIKEMAKKKKEHLRINSALL